MLFREKCIQLPTEWPLVIYGVVVDAVCRMCVYLVLATPPSRKGDLSEAGWRKDMLHIERHITHICVCACDDAGKIVLLWKCDPKAE